MLFLSLHPKNKQFGRLNLPTKQAIPFSHSSFRKMRVQKESRRGSQSGDKPVRTSLRGQRLPPSALAFGGAAQAPEFLTRTGQWLTKASGGGGAAPLPAGDNEVNRCREFKNDETDQKLACSFV